jgi:hypothetical protein
LAVQFADEDLLDELHVTIVPVVLRRAKSSIRRRVIEGVSPVAGGQAVDGSPTRSTDRQLGGPPQWDAARAAGGRTRPAVPPGRGEDRETRRQLELQNSQQQFSNVWGALAVEVDFPAREPVLLVDDLVDSRWTLTVVAAALLEAGSAPVSPIVLAKSVSD